MFSSKISRSVLAAAIFATLPMTATASFAADVTDNGALANLANSSSGPYWTLERMRDAQPVATPKFDAAKLGTPMMLKSAKKTGKQASKSSPGFKPSWKPVPEAAGLRMPLVKLQSTENRLPGDNPPEKAEAVSGTGYPFSTSRVNPRVVTSWPYRLAGKVFFTDPQTGGNFVCSGAIMARRLIVTAGHCVYDRAGDYFYTKHVFVPAYDARRSFQPYGIWQRGYAIAPSQWANSSGLPTTADFAVFAVQDKFIGGQVRKIGEYLGWLGWQTYRLIGNHVKALGYPVNLDSGGRMAQTDGQVYQRTTYAGEIGTAQSGGSSGGPWIQDFGTRPVGQQLINSTGSNRIVAVTSYGPTNFSPWQYSGSSVLNNDFVRIRNKACNAAASNC